MYHVHFYASIMLSQEFIICVKLTLYVLNQRQDLRFLIQSYGTTIKNSVPLVIYKPYHAHKRTFDSSPPIVASKVTIYSAFCYRIHHSNFLGPIPTYCATINHLIETDEDFVNVLLTTSMYLCNSLPQSLYFLYMLETCHQYLTTFSLLSCD